MGSDHHKQLKGDVSGPIDENAHWRYRLTGLVQDADSPLWLKRLPFFFAYFVGCSWSSAALTYRFVRGAKAWKRE